MFPSQVKICALFSLQTQDCLCPSRLAQSPLQVLNKTDFLCVEEQAVNGLCTNEGQYYVKHLKKKDG